MSESLTYIVDADIKNFQNKLQTVDREINRVGNKGQGLGGAGVEFNKTAGIVSKGLSSLNGGMQGLAGGISGIGTSIAGCNPYLAAFVAAVGAIVAGIKAAISGIEEAEIGETLSRKLKLANPFADVDLADYSEKIGISDEFLMELILPIFKNDGNGIFTPDLAKKIWEASGMDKSIAQNFANELSKIAAGKKLDLTTVKRLQKDGVDIIQCLAELKEVTREEAEQMLKIGFSGDDAKRVAEALMAKQAEKQAAYNEIDLSTLENRLARTWETISNAIDTIWLAFRDGIALLTDDDTNLLTEVKNIIHTVTPYFSTLAKMVGAVCAAIVQYFSYILHGIRKIQKWIADKILGTIIALIDLIPDKLKPKALDDLQSTLQDWKNALNKTEEASIELQQATDNISDIQPTISPEEQARLDKQEADLKSKRKAAKKQKNYNERLQSLDEEKMQLEEQYSGELLKLKQREIDLKKQYTQNWHKFYDEELKLQQDLGRDEEAAKEIASDKATKRARQIYDYEQKHVEGDLTAYQQRQELAAKEREMQQQIIDLRLKGADVEANRLEEELKKQQQIASLVASGRTQEEAETFYNSQKELDNKNYIDEYERQVAINELKAQGLNDEAEMLQKQRSIQQDIISLVEHGMSLTQAQELATKKHLSLNDTVNKSVSAFRQKWGEFLKTVQGFQTDEDYKAGGGYNNIGVDLKSTVQSYQSGITNIVNRQSSIQETIASYLSPNGWLSGAIKNINMEGGAFYA